MEKSPGGRTELELAGRALKQTPWSASLAGGLDRPALAVIASHAVNALWPARLDQMIQCIFFSGKPARQRVEIHRILGYTYHLSKMNMCQRDNHSEI